MSTQYKKGSKLLLHLVGGEMYEGTYISGHDRIRITIEDVSKYPSNIKHEGVFHFYNSEIKSIFELDSENDKNASGTLPENKPESSVLSKDLQELIQQFQNRENPKLRKKKLESDIPLDEKEFEELKEKANKYVHIGVVDSSFLDAIKEIKTCEIIAVFGFGADAGRHSKINLLTIATTEKIYLFNIHNEQTATRAFEMGLKNILESKYINKVVHDCSFLADCLKHAHKVTLTNVFDTQVADLLLTRKIQNELPQKMRKLSECIQCYLKIPADIVEKAEPSREELEERPLSNDLKVNIALQTAYLLFLEEILKEKMLEDFHAAVNVYLKSESEEPNAVPKALRDFLFL